jgi:sec-independent protein translocase protein TatC
MAKDRRQQPLPEPAAMSFGDHLEELRRRLIFALLTVLPLFVLSMVFGKELVDLLLRPANAQLRDSGLGGTFIVTNPLEALGAYFRVAAVVTIVVGVPAILFQLWLFISPGLYPHERRFALFLIPLSLLLSCIGLLFLYFVMLPAMLSFLIQFGASMGQASTPLVEAAPEVFTVRIPVLAGDPAAPPSGAVWFNTHLGHLRVNRAIEGAAPAIVGVPMVLAAGIAQQFRVSEYVDLFFTMALAFAIGFQTPVVVLLLGWMGIVDRPMLARKRKHAVFAAFIVSAILTPSPDPFSMALLAVPLYLLYELGVLMLRLLPASRLAEGGIWRRRRGGRGEPPEAGEA